MLRTTCNLNLNDRLRKFAAVFPFCHWNWDSLNLQNLLIISRLLEILWKAVKIKRANLHHEWKLLLFSIYINNIFPRNCRKITIIIFIYTSVSEYLQKKNIIGWPCFWCSNWNVICSRKHVEEYLYMHPMIEERRFGDLYCIIQVLVKSFWDLWAKTFDNKW